jgi:hypothetical protein
MSQRPRRRRGPGTPFVVAVVLLLLLLVAAGAFLLVLHSDNSATPLTQETTTTAATTATGATTTTPAATTTFLAYFVRDGVVGAAQRSIPHTSTVGTAALGQLLDGPTADEQGAHLTTAIPSGTTLDALTIADGVATVKLSHDLEPLAKAQVVFTLTQFPSVRRVAIDGAKPLDRKALESLSPIILVESPTPNETVTSPLTVRGTANTFEATLQLELTDVDGKVLAKRFLTATSGTGTRGTFSGRLAFSADAGTGLVLRAFEDSAENGQRIHVVEIPLVAG